MKKSNRLLIKIGLMFIFLCFLCILYGNSASAATVPVRELNLGDQIDTTEIWEKSAGGDNIYCIDPGTSFEGGKYKVISKYKIEGNTIKANNKIITNPDTKKQLFARAYILTEDDPKEQERLDNTFKYIDDAYHRDYGEHLVHTSERITKNGIYNVLSYKQEALWMFLSHGFWLDQKRLEFTWKTDKAESSRKCFGIGYSNGYYKFLRSK